MSSASEALRRAPCDPLTRCFALELQWGSRPHTLITLGPLSEGLALAAAATVGPNTKIS